MSFEIAASETPRTYRLSGELDLLTADEVATRLEPDVRGHGDIVLDLSDLAFIDSSGIRVFLRTADRMQGRGRLVLRSPSQQVHVILELVGLDRGGSGVVVEGTSEPDWGRPISRSFPADTAVLAQVRSFVRRRAVEDAFGEWADAIVLAVSEAAANAILHSGTSQLQVTGRAFADHVEAEVRDGGVFKRSMGPDVGGGGNRGFLLMMALMDQLSITCGTDRRPGTVVRVVKRRNGRRKVSASDRGSTSDGERFRLQGRVAS